MARTLMVQGTASGVGKSLVVAGLLRLFARKGLRVAPFKAQNMSLHSGVTPRGEEIARSQVLQAQAACIPPDARMNPILLKPEGEATQVVLRGKVFGKLTPFATLPKEVFWEVVEESLSSLCREYDLVLLEGMGSPAEINLRERDMANMILARRFGIPVLLVGDIERGGVFAALYGTWSLCKEDRIFIRGFIINKLRGKKEILQEGVAELERLTGVPVVGIIPYRPFTLDEEDGALFAFRATSFSSEMLKIGVVALRYMANLTDFRPLELEKDVYIRFVAPSENLDFFDLVIIPGTKNTFLDLQYCHSISFGEKLWEFVQRGGVVLGVCGGFQMLGKILRDPESIESQGQEIHGFGFFPMETTLEREKVLRYVEGCSPLLEGKRVTGYEIHHGKSIFSLPCDPFLRVFWEGKEFPEGAVYGGRVFGTYLHGLFDEREFRRAFLNYVRGIRGLPPQPLESVSWKEWTDKELDQLADFLCEHLNMALLGEILGL